jgi:uncharacterized phage protein gp47/JayE
MSTTSLDIDPGPFIPPFLETADTVRARLQAAVPDGMSTEEGSWVTDFVEINVRENVRAYAALNWMLAQCFPAWATGQQLDAHALSYGLLRGLGSYAIGLVRFTATPGTVIDPGVIVEVPNSDPSAERIRYLTTNPLSLLVPDASGYVDAPAMAIAVGAAFNQPAGAVSLLDSVVGDDTHVVSAINNLLPMKNGADPELDYDLRQDVLAQASLPTGSGTIIDHIVWGRKTPGVGAVAAYGQWDTAGVVPGVLDGRQNGSVLDSLLDENRVPVDWSVAYSAQQSINPSRQLIALIEQGEGWFSPTNQIAPPAAPTVTTASTTGTIAPGTYLVAITYSNQFGESTPSAAASVTLGAEGELMIAVPAQPAGATSWNAYVSAAGGAVLYLQQSDGFTNAVTLTALNATGAQPPTTNQTAPITWITKASTPGVQLGATAMEVVFLTGSAETIVVSLLRGMDLSRFASVDGVFLWVYCTNWAAFTSASMIFSTDAGDAFSASGISPAGTAHPTAGAGWWMWRVDYGDFVAQGTPSWSEITQVSISTSVSANCDVVYDYWLSRYNQGNDGVGGLSPIGADVTCISPIIVSVNIELSSLLLQAGFTTTGAPGTTNVLALLQAALADFFSNLAPAQSVRFSDISQVISNTSGVVDFALTIAQASGSPALVSIAYDQFAQLGTITIAP